MKVLYRRQIFRMIERYEREDHGCRQKKTGREAHTFSHVQTQGQYQIKVVENRKENKFY